MMLVVVVEEVKEEEEEVEKRPRGCYGGRTNAHLILNF